MSREYLDLSQKIRLAMHGLMVAHKVQGFKRIRVTGFSQGSTIVHTMVMFESGTPVSGRMIREMGSMMENADMGDLPVDKTAPIIAEG